MAKTGKNTSSQENENFLTEIGKKFKQSPGLYIGSVVILVLVIVAFVGGDLLSGGGFGSGGGEMLFGTYNKNQITLVQGNNFAQNYESVMREFQNYDNYDPSNTWASLQIWRIAFERTVRDIAVADIMSKSKYVVPERLIDRQIALMDRFQENGQFNAALYRATPESVILTLRRQVKEYLTNAKYYADFGALLNYENETNFIIDSMTLNLRSFDAVYFNIADYPESEVLSYARANQAMFDTISLSKITISSSEREARRILDSIRDGTTTFQDAARNFSQDQYAAAGGDMGSRQIYMLDFEIPAASDRQSVYGLRAGELSGVISTANGWVFYRGETARAPSDFNDETVLGRVRSYIQIYEKGRMEDWAINQADAFIADAAIQGFNEAAYQREMEVFSFGPLPVNYGNVSVFTSMRSFYNPDFISEDDMESLAINENFWKTAFSTPINSFSSPFVYSDYVFVLLPTEEMDAEASSIDSIKFTYTYYYQSYISDQMMQLYFINSDKMKDDFWDAFFTYLF